jgi:hypothetical protein
VRGPGKARGLNVRTRPGDQPIVEVGGEIDVHSAAELREQLLRVMRLHSPYVALDLDDVTFMDWAGVEVLLATPTRRAGGRLGPRGPGFAVRPADAHPGRVGTGIRAAEHHGHRVTRWLTTADTARFPGAEEAAIR